MANKEFEMLFKLGAKLGENFNETFRSAQKVLQTTQREITVMNKLQGDIGAYQKQQHSIDKTNDRLQIYQKKLQEVRDKMSSTGDSTSNLAIKEETLRAKIKDTEYVLAQKNAKLTQMGNKLTDAGVDVSKLTDESKRLETEMKNLQNQEMKAAEEAEKFGNKGTSAIEAVGATLVSAGIGSALGKIKDEFTECVNVAMEFGGTMSTVEALSGASGSQIQVLADKAKELGATTAFTANQSAEAMTYMGMAGWNADEMLSGMDGMMSLAAASGEDLSAVSDIVTDNLTAFGLQASDTAHFVDVLAATAANSNTSVTTMGETFKTSGAIAGALGYSIEDVATAVGTMANAGVKGSIAGTALKNIFNGISSEITLTAKAFGEAEYTGVNYDGSMKSLSQVIQDLRGYFEQMTDAEKKANAQAIAGERGYNGLLAILNASEEQYTALSGKINDCAGAAEKMSRIKLDNLQGDVTLLNSAADGLKMTVGEMYNDDLRKLAQLGTKILNGINDFCGKNPVVVKGIISVVAEMALLVGAYTAFNAVKKVKNTLDTLGIALTTKKTAATAASAAAETAEAAATEKAAGAQKLKNGLLSVMSNKVVAGGVAVMALTTAISAYNEAIKKQPLEETELAYSTAEQRQRVAELTEQYNQAVQQYGETSDKALALKYDLDQATTALDNQKFTVGDLYSEIDALHEKATVLFSSMDDGTGTIEKNRTEAHELIAKLKELTTASGKSAKSQSEIENIITRLNELYPTLGLTVDNVSGKIGNLGDKVDKLSQASSWQTQVETAKSKLKELQELQSQYQEKVEEANTAQLAAGERLRSEVEDYNAVHHLMTMFGVAKQYENEYDTAVEEYSKAMNDLNKTNSQIAYWNDVLKQYGLEYEGLSENSVSSSLAISAAMDDVAQKSEALITSYNNAYNAAYDSITGQYALWDDAANVEEIDVADVNDALQSQIDYWNTYSDNVDKLLKRADKIPNLKELIATFSDGSKDSVDAIAGMADASDEDLTQMLKSWQGLQTAQEKASGSLADVRVDFDEQLDLISSDMGERIDKMLSKDDEALAAANSMIDAYCKALIGGKSSVEEAASIVGDAAVAALTLANDYDNAHTPTYNKKVDNTNLAGQTSSAVSGAVAVSGALSGDLSGKTVIYDKDGNAVDAASLFLSNGLMGYASGTENARAGLAIVGEYGPELVNFSGGEEVLTARKTAEIMSSGSPITINCEFNISGNADQSTLTECTDKIVERVRAVLQEESIDARRNAYN